MSKEDLPVIEVVCALIEEKVQGEWRVLAAQRATGDLAGMWEFPGGKVEPGESPADAIVREIKEELLCDITVCDSLPSSDYDYGGGKRVRLLPFLCCADSVMSAVEHSSLRYVTAEECEALDWAPADWPIVRNWQHRARVREKT